MVDRIRYPTVSYLPFYYVFFQFLLLTIFNLQANILTTKDILSNLAHNHNLKSLLTSLKNIQNINWFNRFKTISNCILYWDLFVFQLLQRLRQKVVAAHVFA